jgi:uncharacterized protein (DUF952 family)
MPPIYHLVSREDWDRAPPGPFRPASLAHEGFIHCSQAGQVAWAANRFCRDVPALLVLTIEPDRLTSEVREEPADSGELFPHIYGPIDREAIVGCAPLMRNSQGQWEFHG